VWSYHSFAAWRWVCDSASSGFKGSSMTMISAPRPVSTPPTEGGDARALRRRLELWHRLMAGCEAGREEPLVPVAGEDPPAIARQFVGEVLGVADAQDFRARLVAEAPGRKATEARCDFRWRAAG